MHIMKCGAFLAAGDTPAPLHIHRAHTMHTHWARLGLKIATVAVGRLWWRAAGSWRGGGIGGRGEDQAWLRAEWVGWLMSNEAGCQHKPVIEGGCELPQRIFHVLWQLQHSRDGSQRALVIIVCYYRLDSVYLSISCFARTKCGVHRWAYGHRRNGEMRNSLRICSDLLCTFIAFIAPSGKANLTARPTRAIWLKCLTYTTHQKESFHSFLKSCFVMIFWSLSFFSIHSWVVCLVKCSSPGSLGLWSGAAAGWKATHICQRLEFSTSINQT